MTKQPTTKDPTPTKSALLALTYRAGRIFLFSLPDRPQSKNHACILPTDDSFERIYDAILALPWCKSVEEVNISGVCVITVDDAEPGGDASDDAIRAQLVDVIHRYWRPRARLGRA